METNNTNLLPNIARTSDPNAHINKTILITASDVTKMIDFCKDSEGNVSRDFYDWYLRPQPEYFAKTGMLIIDGVVKNAKIAVSFDLTDPEEVEFNVYRYRDQSIVCNFFFYREENSTLKDVQVDIEYFSYERFKGQDLVWMTPEEKKKLMDKAGRYIDLELRKIKGKISKSKIEKLKNEALSQSIIGLNEMNCQDLVYCLYALMYYVSKQEPEEITVPFQKQLEEETNGVKVKSIYKYTGYIDLRENKVYKPIVKKDSDEPTREYQRHIQKWTVRGHYRRTKAGLIWIEPHVRGEGELEKRIYGTEDEQDLNLIPKVFEVERTTKEKSLKPEQNPASVSEQPTAEELTGIKTPKPLPVIISEKKISWIGNMIKRLRSLLRWKK
jgi:hypothetical protein